MVGVHDKVLKYADRETAPPFPWFGLASSIFGALAWSSLAGVWLIIWHTSLKHPEVVVPFALLIILLFAVAGLICAARGMRPSNRRVGLAVLGLLMNAFGIFGLAVLIATMLDYLTKLRVG